jgi:hypothetical protein
MFCFLNIKGEIMKLGHALMMPFILAAILTGCVKKNEVRNGIPPPPPLAVSVSLFKCNCDPVIQEAVRDSIIDVFFNNTNAKPTKADKGDLTIVGVINMADGNTAYSDGSVGGGGGSSFFAMKGRSSGVAVSGAYISGITMQVYKNGELIATHSVGQDLGGKKVKLISPITKSLDAISAASDDYMANMSMAREHTGTSLLLDGPVKWFDSMFIHTPERYEAKAAISKEILGEEARKLEHMQQIFTGQAQVNAATAQTVKQSGVEDATSMAQDAASSLSNTLVRQKIIGEKE